MHTSIRMISWEGVEQCEAERVIGRVNEAVEELRRQIQTRDDVIQALQTQLQRASPATLAGEDAVEVETTTAGAASKPTGDDNPERALLPAVPLALKAKKCPVRLSLREIRKFQTVLRRERKRLEAVEGTGEDKGERECCRRTRASRDIQERNHFICQILIGVGIFVLFLSLILFAFRELMYAVRENTRRSG